jgi:hypothetical protein
MFLRLNGDTCVHLIAGLQLLAAISQRGILTGCGSSPMYLLGGFNS